MRTMLKTGAAALMLALAACASTPRTPDQAHAFRASAQATLDTMTARDPGLRALLSRAEGYVVFPGIGKGGFIAGGAHGHGVVYQRGVPVGTATLNQGSIGAQLGGQTFSEIIVLRDRPALERLESDNFDVGADISAVVVSAGAAAGAQFEKGVAVFVLPRGGLMVDLSVHGQQINYHPRGV